MNPKTHVLLAATWLLAGLSSQAATYYVNSSTGTDTNVGTSTGAPWKTISRVNTQNLVAGDQVLFQGGQTFSGAVLTFDAGDTGTEANRITVGSYGTGRAIIDGGAGGAVSIWDTGGIVLSNLEIKGAGIGANDGTGVDIGTDLVGRLPGVRIQNCDIYGFGLHVDASNKPKSGHGIFAWGWRSDGQLSGFNNVEVLSTVVHNCENTGFGTWAGVLYGITNVTVRDSTFHDNPGRAGVSNHSGNGVVLGTVDTGLIERCVAYSNGTNNNYSAGPVGIWAYDSKNITIQFCESYNNRSNGGDGGGFDLDGGVTNSVIQYCYSHGNYGAGYLLACYGSAPQMSNNTIRYNISENDGRRGSYGGITFWGNGSADKVENCVVHNNVIYTGTETAVVSGTPAAVRFLNTNVIGAKLWNNIFLTNSTSHRLISSGTALATTVAQFQRNNYWAYGSLNLTWGSTTYTNFSSWTTAASTQERDASNNLLALNVNPLLTAPGTGGTIGNPSAMPATLTAYKLSSASSPMVNTALNLSTSFGVNPGSRDFYGNSLSGVTQFDLGAHEYTAALTWTSSIVGTVTAPGTFSVSGGTYTVSSSGTSLGSGSADNFRFAYVPMTNGCSITARVVSITGGNGVWNQAGVMIRESVTAPGSRHVSSIIRGGQPALYCRRTVADQPASSSASSTALPPPYWVKVTRVGDTFSVYRSADGTWGSPVATVTIVMASQVYAGLALTSSSSTAATATFDNVSVSTAP